MKNAIVILQRLYQTQRERKAQFSEKQASHRHFDRSRNKKNLYKTAFENDFKIMVKYVCRWKNTHKEEKDVSGSGIELREIQVDRRIFI